MADQRSYMISLVQQTAPKYGIDPQLMISIGMKESGLNPAAVGDGGWSRGAWQIYLKAHNITQAQAHDPVFSTDYAAQFLARLFKRFGNVQDVLSAYNSGKPLAQAPVSTRNYVASILGGEVAGATTGEMAGMSAGQYGQRIAGISLPKPRMRTTPFTAFRAPKQTVRIKLPKSKFKLPEPANQYKIKLPGGSSLAQVTSPKIPTIKPFKVSIPKTTYPKVRLSGLKIGR